MRAGTSKAVLYRRWRNCAELVLAALRRRRPMLSGPTPETGSLRDDVLTLLRRAYAGIAEIGQETMFGLLDEVVRRSRRPGVSARPAGRSRGDGDHPASRRGAG